MTDVNSGHLTAIGVVATLGAVRPKAKIPPKQQLGVRVDAALVVEAKVLAVRQRRRVNDLVEEAIRDLLRKYREKRKV
ncbi:MAG: hypothetical protein ACE5NA_06920 [Nitrospiraceae bacterium]